MIVVGTSGYNYPEWKGTFYPVRCFCSCKRPLYWFSTDFADVVVGRV